MCNLEPSFPVSQTARRGMSDSSWGQLSPLISDPTVTDIFVNGDRGVWVDRGCGPVREDKFSFTSQQIHELIIRLISLGNRHIDEATPCVDVRLHGGVRVHAVLPPVSTIGPLLSVRLPSLKPITLEDLKNSGFFNGKSMDYSDWLTRQVLERKNILITGAAGTGKTTLLSALLREVPENERIIVIEDVAEINIVHPHVISLEARQANSEGAGEISLITLLKNALRMRPDRLVLGECRGGEIRELFSALNTGHNGGSGTLHANSLLDVPARLEAMCALADMTASSTARQAFSAIDIIVHLEQSHGARRISAIGCLAIEDNRLKVNELSCTEL